MKPGCLDRTPHLGSRTRAPAAAVAMMLAVAACDTAPTARTDSEQAQIVLERSDVHVLGTSELIAAIVDLEVLPDGTVWVLNSVEPFFLGFDPDGDLVRTFGSEGGGPEDFQAPSGFVAGGIDDEAWVLDTRRHALIEVSRPDSVRRDRSLPGDGVPPGRLLPGDVMSPRVRTERLGNALILAPRSGDVELNVFGYWLAVWTADLLALDLDSDAVRDVIALGSVLGDPRAHFELTGASLPFPLWFRLWTVCADAEIRVYDRLRNEVRGFALDGTELEAAVLPPVTLTEVSARQFAEVTLDMAVIELMGQVPPPGGRVGVSAADSARLMDGVVSSLEASPAQLANLLPRYVDLRCDDEGRLWIKPFDIDAHGGFAGGMKGGSRWLRIAPDGETRAVRMPDRFDPHRFTDGRVWGVQRDELDVASVAWIELPPAR